MPSWIALVVGLAVVIAVILIARYIDDPPHKQIFRAHRNAQRRVRSVITESDKDPRIVGDWVQR